MSSEEGRVGSGGTPPQGRLQIGTLSPKRRLAGTGKPARMSPMYGGRMTINEMLAFQPANRPAVTITARYSAPFAQTGDLVTREIVVRPEWQPLDTGGVDAASVMVLKNMEGTEPRDVYPSAEEVRESAARVVEIAFAPPDLNLESITDRDIQQEVLPGQDCRLRARNLSRYAVRCRYGVTKVTLYLAPV